MREYYFNTNNKSTNVRVKTAKQSVFHWWLLILWRWAPGFTRWLMLRLFFAPKPYRAGVEEEACLKQGRPFQIKVHDKAIQGWKWGRGPAVLLVHGWSGRGVQFHRFIEPLVSAGYTAVAIDGPAHGASSGRITSYFEFTDTIRLLLSRNQGFDFQAIIAHSFGAAAAINALAKEGLAMPLVCVAPVLNLVELLHMTFERYGIPRTIYTALINEFEMRLGYSLRDDNPRNLLKNVPGSVLIVHDAQDRTASFQVSQDQAGLHAHTAFHATRGLGHRRILVDARVVHRCLAHVNA